MMKVTLTSATGKQYLLSGAPSQSPVLATRGALSELVGRMERTNLSIPSLPGALPGARRFAPIDAEVEFVLHADDGEQLERVFYDFRAGWSFTKPSRLEVESPAGLFHLDVVLGAPIRGVAIDPTKTDGLVVPVTVFSAVGLFSTHTLAGSNYVTVTNNGDAVIFPRITYTGGGVVAFPSGATAALPTTSRETTIDTSPLKLRTPGVFSEGVEPGQSASWTLPPGSTLEWELLVADPWTRH